MPATFRRYDHRPSAAEARNRRFDVFRLLMRGIKKAAIARTLGVSEKCVAADAEWIRQNLRDFASNADTFAEVGEAAAELREVKQEAMYHFSQAGNHHAKNAYLLTAMQAIERRLKIMMDAGIIERAPTIQLDIDVAKLSTVELMKRREMVLEQIAKMGFGGLVAAPKSTLLTETQPPLTDPGTNGHPAHDHED